MAKIYFLNMISSIYLCQLYDGWANNKAANPVMNGLGQSFRAVGLGLVHKTPHGLNPSMIKIASCNPVCVPFPAQKHNTHIFIHGILQLLVWLVNESSRTELSGVFEM